MRPWTVSRPVASWDALHLGVHRAITTDDAASGPALPELTSYVLRAHDHRLRELLAALTDGIESVHRDPNAAIKQIADVSGADIPLVRAQMQAVDPLFDPPMRFDKHVLAEWAAWDAKFGILPRRPSVARLFASP